MNLAVCRRDVLIDVEEIAGVVLGLDLSQSGIVTPISRLDPVLAFVHHEVDVGTAH